MAWPCSGRGALRLGGHGVVRQARASPLLVQGGRQGSAGAPWVAPAAGRQALEGMRPPQEGMQARTDLWTPRAQEMVRLVARGWHHTRLAEALAIRQDTVQIPLHHSSTKLRRDQRLALTLYARDRGLV